MALMKLLRFLSLLLVVVVMSQQVRAQLRIIQKPIVFDDTRRQLTLDYIRLRYGIDTNSVAIVPQMVVVHWTAIDSFEESYKTMRDATLPGSRANIGAKSPLNVSAHYLVDRDGTIYQLLPDTVFARHVIGLNYHAIGIENVGSPKCPLTPQQLKANEKLIRHLASKYPIRWMIGHYEYKKFAGSPLWLEKDPEYLTEKDDPGTDFMARLRKLLKDLKLKNR